MGCGRRPPLLPPALLPLFRLLRPTLGHTADRAAMLLSFWVLLRKGHVTVSDNVLCRKDVTFHLWGLMLNISKSKTIKFRKKVHRTPVAKVGNRDLCAVHWVQRHFEECPAPAGALAFRLQRVRHSITPTYTFYLSVIKHLCMQVGLEGQCHLPKVMWGAYRGDKRGGIGSLMQSTSISGLPGREIDHRHVGGFDLRSIGLRSYWGWLFGLQGQRELKARFIYICLISLFMEGINNVWYKFFYEYYYCME